MYVFVGTHNINTNDWSCLYDNGETIFTPDHLKDISDTLRDAYKDKTNIDFDNVNNISPEDLLLPNWLNTPSNSRSF